MRLINSQTENFHVSPKRASERNDKNTFQITQDLEFDKENTLIVAENGAGKSIIGMILLSPFMTEKEEVDGKSLNILANPYPGDRAKLPTIITEKYQKDAGEGYVTIGLVLNKANEDDSDYGLARYGFISTIPATEMEELHLTANEDGTASDFEDVKQKLKDLHKKHGAKFKYWSKGSEFRKALKSEGFNFDVQNYNIAINNNGEGNIAGYFKKQNSSEKLIKEILVDAVSKKRNDVIADPVGEYFGFRKANDEIVDKVNVYKKFQAALPPVFESEKKADEISATLNQAYATQYNLQQGIEGAIAESKLREKQLQNESGQKTEEAKKLRGFDLMQGFLQTDEKKTRKLEQKEETLAEKNATEKEILEAARAKFVWQLAEKQAEVNAKNKAYSDIDNRLKALREKHTKDEQVREAAEIGGKLRSYWESEEKKLNKEKKDLDKTNSDQSNAISRAKQEIKQKQADANQLAGGMAAQYKLEAKQAEEVQGLFEQLPEDFQDWQPGLDGLIDNTETLKEAAKEKREKAESNAEAQKMKLASGKSNAEQLKSQKIKLDNDRENCQKEIDILNRHLQEVDEQRSKLTEIQKKLGLDVDIYDVQPAQMAIEEKHEKSFEKINELNSEIKDLDEEEENLKSGLQLTKEAKEFLQETLGEDFYHTGEDFLSEVGGEKAENLKRNLPAISAAIVMEKGTIDKLAGGKIVPGKPPVSFPVVLKDDALELANTVSDKEISYISGEGKLKLYSYVDPELQTKEGREKRKKQLESQKQDREERISRLKEKIEDLKNLNHETARITKVSKEFEDDLKRKLTDKTSQLEQKEKEIATGQQELNRLTQELDTYTRKLEQAQKALESAKENERIAADIAKKNEDLRQTKNAIATLNQKKAELTKEIQLKEAVLKEAEQAHSKSIEKLEAVKTQLEQAKEKANAYITYKAMPMPGYQEIPGLESRFAVLKDALGKKYAAEETLEDRLSSAKKELDGANEGLDATKADFDNAKVKDGLAEISEVDIKEKISALGGSLNFDKQQSAKKQDQFEQKIRDLSRKIGEFNSDIKTIEKDIKNLNRNLSNLMKKIKDLPYQVDKAEVEMNRDYKTDAQRADVAAQKAKEDANKEESRQQKLTILQARLGDEVKKPLLAAPAKIDFNDLDGLDSKVKDVMDRIKKKKSEEKDLENSIDAQLKNIQSSLNRLNKDEEEIFVALATIRERAKLQAKFATLHSFEEQTARFLDEKEEFIEEASERRNHAIMRLTAKAKILINELKDVANGSRVKTENGIKKLMALKKLPEEITSQSAEGLLDHCYEAYLQNGIFKENKEDQRRWLEGQLGWKSVYQDVVERAANGNIFVRLRLLKDDKFSTWETWQGASSGGQETTTAFIVLFSIVHYLAKTINPMDDTRMIEHSEFLVLDNPFAKVQSGDLIKTIYATAKAAKIQLICFTNIKMEAIMNISNKTYNFKAVTTEEGVKTGENTRDFDVIKDNEEKSLEAITTFEQAEETTLF